MQVRQRPSSRPGPAFGRRAALAAAAALLPAPARAEAEAALLVAGPAGSRLDEWAAPLATALGRDMPSQGALPRRNLGGLDGVTAANAFEARTEPDGGTALLLPGAAMLPWMVGDPRAKFDPARWLPLWAAVGPAVLVSRVRLERGNRAAIAAADPAGPELPALLALDLLGVAVTLVQPSEADTVLLTGPDLPATMRRAEADGMRPAFILTPADADPDVARPPALTNLPTAAALLGDRPPAELLAALHAASLAVQLEAGLVLPLIAPAAAIAAWRRACRLNLSDRALDELARSHGARMLPPERAAAWLGPIAGHPGLLLALRRWLAARHNWSPT